jgi:hypothetical protein
VRTLGSGLRRSEQLAGALDIGGSERAGEETVVADAVALNFAT